MGKLSTATQNERLYCCFLWSKKVFELCEIFLNCINFILYGLTGLQTFVRRNTVKVFPELFLLRFFPAMLIMDISKTRHQHRGNSCSITRL